MAKISIRSVVRGMRKIRKWLSKRGTDRIGAGLAAASGDAARDHRLWHQAAEHYARALSANPGWTAIRVQRANMLKEAGELEAAEEEYRRALDAEPANADTWLQLGHALKLQMRLTEAREAYLAAATRDADLQPARTELRALGMSDAAVERHIAASTSSIFPNRGDDPLVSHRDLRPVDNSRRSQPSGIITDVGRDYVAGELTDLSAVDLPIALVCRENGHEVATWVLDADKCDGLPGSISFRFDFGDPEALGVLEISIEPGRTPLVGSPFLLPNVTGSTLLERVARLEDRVVSPTISDDIIGQLERRLTPRIARRATDQLEQVIRYQREAFERQLLAMEARLDPALNLVSDLSQPQGRAPAVKIFTASEMFPGLGWSSAEPGSGGLLVRRIIDRGQLAVRLAQGCGTVLRARIPAITSRGLVSRIRVGAAGNWLPSWIEFREKDDLDNAYWQLTALIPSTAVDFDGTVNCFIDCAGSLGNVGSVDGIGITEVGLYSIPTCEAATISVVGYGWWTLARDSNGRHVVVLPGLEGTAKVALKLSGEFRMAGIELNGYAIEDMDLTSEPRVVPIAPEKWNIRTPNLLVLSRLTKDAKGEIQVVDITDRKSPIGM